jgi:hypothetical protein
MNQKNTKEIRMTEQNAGTSKSRTEMAKEQYLKKESSKGTKAKRDLMPYLLGLLVLIAILLILSIVYIGKMHNKEAQANAAADLETMFQVDGLKWDSTTIRANWAYLYCTNGDIAVVSSKKYNSSELRNCSYALASDVNIVIATNIWSTKGKIQFVPAE